MASPRFYFGLGSRLAVLVLASAAAIGSVCGCGGNGGASAAAPSAAVSSAPRGAGGLEFTGTANHGLYVRGAPIVLTYSITDVSVDQAAVSTTDTWFHADAVSGSQTVDLIPGPSGPGGALGPGFEVERFPLFVSETASYQETAPALPPGKWQITCWLAGSIGGIADASQPPYQYAANPVTITVLR
ncbi:MAG: hypothetical protein KGJ62_00990 [Armatimonadetes bacterium]|nr:hypothetical protein [Armatimonadota bacterium]MDE2207775.1 hypothetical protein [Armatimonadota bacterium]